MKILTYIILIISLGIYALPMGKIVYFLALITGLLLLILDELLDANSGDGE